MELARKRLRHEIRVVKRGDIHTSGIFINVDADDEFLVRALVIGPDDTPYRHGNFFFDLKFSSTEYPFVPPVVTLRTLEQGVRFNPNLYEKGKVCISILNTWQGEQWTSCQSLQSVLLMLQTIMTDEPLQNEPGFTKDTVATCPRHKRYYELVEFNTFRVAILKMFSEPPPGFEIFMPVVRTLFLDHFDAIMSKMKEVAEKTEHKQAEVKCLVYNTPAVLVDYETLMAQMEQFYTLFVADAPAEHVQAQEGNGAVEDTPEVGECEPPKDSSKGHQSIQEDSEPPKDSSKGHQSIQEDGLAAPAETSTVITDELPDSSSSSKKRQRPKVKAREFTDGYTSTVDGTCWVVYTDKKGSKRWRVSDK